MPTGKSSWLYALAGCALFCAAGVVAQQPRPEPQTIPLVCAGRYCPLLKGPPQTAGMRSGFVRLAPGETVGRHTTGDHEGTLVILRGRGVALLDGGRKLSFTAPAAVYIPPSTFHNVLNAGKGPLEYIYVVAPAAQR